MSVTIPGFRRRVTDTDRYSCYFRNVLLGCCVTKRSKNILSAFRSDAREKRRFILPQTIKSTPQVYLECFGFLAFALQTAYYKHYQLSTTVECSDAAGHTHTHTHTHTIRWLLFYVRILYLTEEEQDRRFVCHFRSFLARSVSEQWMDGWIGGRGTFSSSC